MSLQSQFLSFNLSLTEPQRNRTPFFCPDLVTGDLLSQQQLWHDLDAERPSPLAFRAMGFPGVAGSKIFSVPMIRNFRNADLPAIADVWMRHWSWLSPPPVVTAAMIEQAILSRTFFDPSRLLVAEQDDRVQGWCHFADGHDWKPKTAVICAICLTPGLAASVGEELLAATLQRIGSSHFRRIEAGPLRDDQFGYAGLEPIGHGIGIPEADSRINTLLTEGGFTTSTSATRMTISTQAYRMPISREALQYRRSTRSTWETPSLDEPRQASAMAHFDIERHHLLDRAGKRIASVDLWCSDPEAEVMRSDHAILDIQQAHQRGSLDPPESFLLATVLQSLAGRHIFQVETSIDSEYLELGDQLKLLLFREQQRGTVWTKKLG